MAAAEENPEDDTSEPSEQGDDTDVASRPDRVSAALAARSLDKRVEDESARNEFSRSFVNPDGSTTLEAASGVQSVQDDDGAWRDVDMDLAEQADGSFAPKVSPTDVTVGGGGSGLAAKVALDDASLAVSWPEDLPEPTVDGAVATYKLSETSDLLVIANRSGTAVRVRLNAAPAEDDPALTLGLKTDALDVTETSQDRLKVTGDDGVVATTAPMMAWDARTDGAGDPNNFVAVEPSLEEISSSGDVTKQKLTLEPAEGFLADPTTEYPVIIDPDISSVLRYRDTMVREDYTTSRGSDSRLWAGRLEDWDSSLPWVSYVQWKNDQLAGKSILKATANLYQYSSGSCSPRALYAQPLLAGFTDSTVWSNRPAGTSTAQGSTTAQGSNGGCLGKNGWVSINTTAMAKKWADGSLTNYGVRFKVADANASDLTYRRRFCSMNEDPTHPDCNSQANDPRLSVTYDGPPKTPTGFSANPSTSTGTTLWTSSNKPKISVPLVEPEAQLVKAQVVIKQGSITKADFNTPTVASGATATATVPSGLADGTYTVQTRAIDSAGNASPYTAVQTLKVDTAAPASPIVSCSGYNSGTWYDARPSGTTTCAVAGTSDGTVLDWTRNGRAQDRVLVSGTSTSLGTFTIPANGVFGVAVKVVDAAGNSSSTGEFGFGTGDAGMTSPVSGERTSSTVTINASAPDGATWARVERKAEADSSWTEVSNVRPKGSLVGWSHLPASAGDGSATTGDLVWDMSSDGALNAPSTQQVRVCFVFPGVTRCTTERSVTLVPSAFGGSFPTQEVGPGQVALFTGEFAVDETDVSVPGYGGDLSLGRSHHTFEGEKSAAASVFGPGWTSDLSGPDAGQAGLDVIDHTADEAAISLVSSDGSTSTYAHEDGAASAQRVGFYEGDAETGTDNDVLEIEDRSGSKYLRLTEEDGTVTEWKHVGSGVWATEKVIEPFDQSTTTFTHDVDGRVTGIYAPAPSGVTCNATSQTEGCRALQLTYIGVGAATRVSKIDLRIWDSVPASDGTPSGSKGMTTKTVAKYSYDTVGRLQAAWDPRLGDGASALKTTYQYDAGAGGRVRLTTATPPGETAWRFAYDGVGRFSTAKRAHPDAVGSGDATWTVDYETALSGSGLPSLNATSAASWGQPTVPSGAATVFGPDAPGTTDYSYGTISYFDIEGRTTNTASYGAGEWQVDSTGYDAQGNVVWALDEGNRATALASEGETAAVANTLATLTTYDAAGARIEKTLGPTRQVVLENGSLISGRDLSTTVYDDEAAAESVPTPGRPVRDTDDPATNLPVEDRSGVADADGNTYDVKKTRYRYDAVSSGDGDGWKTGAATRTMVQLGSSWSTTLTRFDTDGKIVEIRTPQGVAAIDGSANDTRSRKTVYYTADASSPVTACRDQKAWVGLECQVGPAGQPLTGKPIPITRTTGYDYLLNPTRVVEESGPISRTLVTGYDAAGRTTTDKLDVSGAPSGDQPVADTTISYSPTTGALESVMAGSKTQTSTYDSWGRLLTQTDGNGTTGTTTYSTTGQVKTFNDGKGTYTYSYDGVDAAGKAERRGLVTKVDVGLATGPSEFKTASDADGNRYLTKYPNQMVKTSTFDAAGTQTASSYVDSAGGEVVGFTNTVDVDSRVRFSSSIASDQNYTYDDRGRLTKVEDTTATGCITRQYKFSLDSNREKLETSTPVSNGMCSSASPAVIASNFDSADRITGGTYDYDELGRTRVLPKADTDQGGQGFASDLQIAYYGNDMAAKLSQSVPNDDNTGSVAKTKTFTLDVAQRLSKAEDTSAGVTLRQTDNHYADSGDAPTWISDKTRSSSSAAWAETWTRNVLGPDGDLAVIQRSTGPAEIQISNLRGDIVTQVDNTIGATAPDSYVETTEYGLPKMPDTSLGQNYGWLGAKLRSSDASGGLVLMGARLYNPISGRFASRDSVYAGNDNAYVYPADPINQFDLDGRETTYITNKSGRKVPVDSKAKRKVAGHNLGMSTLKWAFKRAKVYSSENKTTVYRLRVYEHKCKRGHCEPTGRTLVIRFVVSTKKHKSGPRKGKVKGLVTAYCEGYDPRCPNWVNTKIKR